MSEFVYVKGKTKWFRNITPSVEYEKWSHVLYPDAESLEIIRDLQAQGIKNRLKKDDDGYFITFSRPINMKVQGKVKGLSPPLVVDIKGVPTGNTLIGNGSDITTKLDVYSHKTPGGGKAKAARWEGSRIDNLVPFEKKDYDPVQEKQAEGLNEQPAPIF